MGCLEILTDENYREFLETGVRVLVLTQRECPHCRAWTAEISAFLESDHELQEVRFGKIDLECNDLENFKKANDWLEFVPGVPFNIIYTDGHPANSFAGSGIRRMVKRLRRLSNSTSIENIIRSGGWQTRPRRPS